MPFIALSKETGQRLDITTIEHPREWKFVECPFCGGDMFAVGGPNTQVVFHWRHRKDTDCPSAAESPEHKAAKLYIQQQLRSWYLSSDNYGNPDIVLEYPVGDRRADVAELWPSGVIIAHEIQLSSIPLREIQERSDDYRRQAAEVRWYFSRSASSRQIRKWCLTKGYSCKEISFDKSKRWRM